MLLEHVLMLPVQTSKDDDRKKPGHSPAPQPQQHPFGTQDVEGCMRGLLLVDQPAVSGVPDQGSTASYLRRPTKRKVRFDDCALLLVVVGGCWLLCFRRRCCCRAE